MTWAIFPGIHNAVPVLPSFSCALGEKTACLISRVWKIQSSCDDSFASKVFNVIVNTPQLMNVVWHTRIYRCQNLSASSLDVLSAKALIPAADSAARGWSFWTNALNLGPEIAHVIKDRIGSSSVESVVFVTLHFTLIADGVTISSARASNAICNYARPMGRSQCSQIPCQNIDLSPTVWTYSAHPALRPLSCRLQVLGMASSAASIHDTAMPAEYLFKRCTWVKLVQWTSPHNTTSIGTTK